MSAPSFASRLADAVAEEHARQLSKAAQKAEDRAALNKLAEDMAAGGMDMDSDRRRQRGEFNRLCRDLAALPAPAEFLARQGDWLTDRHRANAEAAFEWLHDFHAIQGGDGP